MNPGLKWSEVYSWISDVTKMLYTVEDTYEYGIHTESISDPGKYWEYSSGTTNILSGLIRKVIGNDIEYLRFPFVELAEPLGMKSFVMELDAKNNFVGSSYSYGSALDWAKFGQLLLNKGNWQNKQIIPEAFVEFLTETSEGSEGRYGGQFWLNRDGKFKDVPKDMYYADGFQGQRVFIIPSERLIVVRLGMSIKKQPDYNNLLGQIISVLNNS
jgi:CubicO group peptidase (beta-lactamase class C family)